MSGEPTVEEFFADHTDVVAATAARLRGVLLDGHPDLEERVRPGWHSVNYHHPVAGFVCAIFPFADRVELVLEHGAALPDPHGRLSGSGRRVRTLQFADAADVDPAVVLEFLDLAVDVGTAMRARARR